MLMAPFALFGLSERLTAEIIGKMAAAETAGVAAIVGYDALIRAARGASTGRGRSEQASK